MMSCFFIICTIVCLIFFYLSVKNAVTLKKLTYSPDRKYSPAVSVLLPVRNEEKNVGACLDSLVKQDYPNYEILVIDDNSTDNTLNIITEYEAKYAKIKVISGKPLPSGWLGKPFACHQLSEHATGEYLFFTDADTIHRSNSISWAITNIERHNAEFLSAYVRHTIGSIGEAILIPVIYILTTLFLPLWLVPEKNNSFISFGFGQLIVCKRRAFTAIGGYTGFKNAITEDMAMARTMKAFGFKTVFLDAKEYIDCRMYTSFMSAFNGLAKLIFSAINQNILLLVGLFLLIAGIIELPVLFFAVSVFRGFSPDTIFAAIPCFVFFFTWLGMLINRRIPFYLALFYPVVFLILLIIAIVSSCKTGFGNGIDWKGRLVKCDSPPVYRKDVSEEKI